MADDPQIEAHRAWLHMLQPTGLVVSPPALAAARCVPDRLVADAQERLRSLVDDGDDRARGRARPPLAIASFAALAREVLGWDAALVAGMDGGPPIPDTLRVVLREFEETLRPSFAVRDVDDAPDAPPWQLLVVSLSRGVDFDLPRSDEAIGWRASPQVRIERLLRETGVLAGVLFNGEAIRLVCAPRGESSGHLTWPVYALCEVQGRPLLSALRMLLGRDRLFSAPRAQSLLAVLRESRRYQSVVSTTLAGQVLEALNELLRGFQAANEAARGALLDDTAARDPEHVYGGLLAVLLRLVFVLFAEERGLLASARIYSASYALTGLFEQLRADAGRHPDTMDQRYGAWARVCVLVRMIYDGAKHGSFELLPRQGHLFDPDAWPFLEGRAYGSVRRPSERLAVPRVSDGVVFRVLEKLLVLDGERLSYRALDVEQIGSVYENMMGFALLRASEVSLGVGAKHVVVGLETLLAVSPIDRVKALKDLSDTELTGKAAEALRRAITVDALVAAIGKRASALTPRPVPRGGFYLQPGEERRRSGSHYTPRALTSPVVRATLEPLLSAMGPTPRPDEILALRVCDPAMGSGAFLVETCRQLAEALVRAWDVHGRPPQLKADEDPLLFAQRQVALRCLYGVDRNRLAVDLAKLSLWLATLAREHAFGFVDHALREGDSLVGLSREQIAAFHWEPSSQVVAVRRCIEARVSRAEGLRARIRDLSDADDDGAKRRLLREADEALDDVRLVGDCVVACFFGAVKDVARRRALAHWQSKVVAWLDEGRGREEIVAFVDATMREGARPIRCFHWEIESPEVFARDAVGRPVDGGPTATARGGFDAIVGNPPWVSYAGKAAQPIADPRRAWYDASYSAFAGYKNLQGLFLERIASIGRPRARVGVVLPSSMAELDGYAPTRAAFDRAVACDPSLPDLGEDSFRGVSQPSMALHGTSRSEPLREGSDAPWPIERPDVDDEATRILARLDAPPFPPETFGERGLQTLRGDTDHFTETPDAQHTAALRVGADIAAFRLGPPSIWADPAHFGSRLRPDAEWQRVDVVIRQTARVPIAARSDGLGFRNTLLAAFASETFSAGTLLAWLNSNVVRWSHYYRNRDARLGMPQVKIGHLRSLPAPPASVRAELHRIGEALAARNAGLSADEQRALDELAATAFGLTPDERARITRDAERW